MNEKLKKAIADIYATKSCMICKHYSRKWDSFCINCDNAIDCYRPSFVWRGESEDKP